ncbi:universal stress protein [bacterium]|nr:universal stress protein [bacterium]
MYWLPRQIVLVPTDFSQASVDSVHTALAMVEAGCCVHVLHVVPPLPDDLSDTNLSEHNSQELSGAGRLAHAKERLADFSDAYGLTGVTLAAVSGDPALEITRYANGHDVDLIVIAAHGYVSGEPIPLGSVTERVLHNADCSILVLRPDRRAKQPVAGGLIREGNGFSPVEDRSRASVKPR